MDPLERRARAAVEPRDVRRARWRAVPTHWVDPTTNIEPLCYRETGSRTRPRCLAPAGHRTGHPGYGACRGHGGGTTRQERAWRMAIELAAELNVTPWDALLQEVRISAARRAWLWGRFHDALGEDRDRFTIWDATDATDDQLPSALRPEVTKLLRELRAEGRHLAAVSQAAIHAGVAERIVQQIELDGTLVADAVTAALDALQLEGDARVRALAAAHARLELEVGGGNGNGSVEPPRDASM